MIFFKVLDAYMDTLKAKNHASKTLKTHRRVLKNFWVYIHGKSLKTFDEVALKTVSSYVDHLKGPMGHCHNYVYLEISCIKGFFHYLYRKKLIETDELASYSFIRPVKSLPKNIPREDEVHDLLSGNLKLLDKTILELYYATGIRHSELIHLNISDIDFEANLIFIREGKGKKDRHVPVTDHALGLIKDYLESRTTCPSRNDPLFLSSTGNRVTPTVIQRIFKQLKTDIKVTPHSLRHAFATHMLKRGAHVRDIQEILGHEDMGTTERYTKVEISDLKRCIKRFHPRENEIYTDDTIILPLDQFFTRKKGFKRNRKIGSGRKFTL